MNPLKLKLHWQILIALVLAVLVGLVVGRETGVLGVTFYSIFDFVGKLFLNALKMLIVPLIISSIVVGVAGVGGTHGPGRLGGKTISYYMATSLLAILVGLVAVNLIQPGVVDGDPREVFGFTGDTAALQEKIGDKGGGDVAEVFLRMIPTNVVEAAAQGQMLGLIFFSLLYGFFLTRITEDYAEAQYNFFGCGSFGATLNSLETAS